MYRHKIRVLLVLYSTLVLRRKVKTKLVTICRGSDRVASSSRCHITTNQQAERIQQASLHPHSRKTQITYTDILTMADMSSSSVEADTSSTTSPAAPASTSTSAVEAPIGSTASSSSTAMEQTRLRKERREAKIKAGGSARLGRITSMAGGRKGIVDGGMLFELKGLFQPL